MHAVNEIEAQCREITLGAVAADFAGQVATAVWLGKLTDEAACEALWSYALACHGGARPASTRMCAALTSEYRRRREWQDACE